jgi:gamma-glutamyl-gamma-aminobutyrate hydrolase PuuD
MIINGSDDYNDLFVSMGHTITQHLAKAELLVFTGGADVSPNLYGDYEHRFTGSNPARDKNEASFYTWGVKNDIPMVGICRGAQFLNVMSGGRMYQHVERHTRSHTITDVVTGETVYVSSTHHQMMMPSFKALLVATAALGGEREWFDGAVARKDVSKEDIEVVYYEHSRSLCFQPHPEFNRPEYEGMKAYFKGLLARYLGVQ